ncbi:MAG: PIN domain-containing protein [Acidobacteria bacterium]|nr:PIN domain-containing protein [Acidobacteriota bacterium]
MEYSLDTNAGIALLNGSSATLRTMVTEALGEGSVLCVSSVVLHELWFGAAKSGRPAHNASRIHAFLSGPVHVLPFDEADARAAGEVRARLQRAGTPISAYDTMIAGQVRRRGLTVITADTDCGCCPSVWPFQPLSPAARPWRPGAAVRARA